MAREPAGAREAILSALAAYERAEIRCRPADLAAVFAVRGVLEIGGRVLRGRPTIRAALEALVRRPRVAGSPSWPTGVARRIRDTEVIFISAVEARARSRFEATSASGRDHRGHYDDRFVYDAAGGAWLIAHRSVHVDPARRARWLPGSRRPAMAGPSISTRPVRPRSAPGPSAG